MLHRQTFPVGALGCNCTILADTASNEALVIDPGDEVPRIVAELKRAGLQVRGIVHTHAHIDHIGGSAELAAQTGAAAHLHPADAPLYALLTLQAQMLGLAAPAPPIPMQDLADGQSLRFGAYELGVLHTPGHSPGSVCFLVPGCDLCFTGDTLFAGGVGRTDLWGGDGDALIHSIRDRLYSLPGDLALIPGHGPPSTLDRERRSNPYVRA